MTAKPPDKYEETIIPLLARGSTHLPGNNWKEDYLQYIKNEHIVLGICFHHPLHPLERWERILALIGSISFGLAATNAAYLWDAFSIASADADDALDGVLLFYIFESNQIYITKGIVLLWTLGGVVHSLFDFAVWRIMACPCFHPGGRWGDSPRADRLRNCGSYILIPVIMGLMGLATYAVLVRASELDGADGYDEGGWSVTRLIRYEFTESDGDEPNDDDQGQAIDWDKVREIRSFSFLAEFAIQMALAWTVYFFTIRTIIFSGVLGCGGRLPVLGGRPRDVKKVEEQAKREAQGGGVEKSYKILH